MFKFILPRFILRIERWKWNKEYRIYVSNMGHFMDEYKRPIPVKINASGYVVVPIGYGKLPLAHRIVMKTWRPTTGMEELTVDHLDHNKRNNAAYNLEWVTEAENLRRAAEDYIPTEPKNPRRRVEYIKTLILLMILIFMLVVNIIPLLKKPIKQVVKFF